MEEAAEAAAAALVRMFQPQQAEPHLLQDKVLLAGVASA
jgi:hypothetical protein